MTCCPVTLFNGFPVGLKGITVRFFAEYAGFKNSGDALDFFGEGEDFLPFAGLCLGGDLVFEGTGFFLVGGAFDFLGVVFAAVGFCLGGDLVFEAVFLCNFGVTPPGTAFAAFFFCIHPCLP